MAEPCVEHVHRFWSVEPAPAVFCTIVVASVEDHGHWKALPFADGSSVAVTQFFVGLPNPSLRRWPRASNSTIMVPAPAQTHSPFVAVPVVPVYATVLPEITALAAVLSHVRHVVPSQDTAFGAQLRVVRYGVVPEPKIWMAPEVRVASHSRPSGRTL